MTAGDQRLLITLADLPGLDPVGLCDEGGRIILSGVGDDGGQVPTLISVAEHHGSVFWRRVHIDLSDPATRDRCLRWLAGRVGLAVGCGAPAWEVWTDLMASWELAGMVTWDASAPVVSREGKAFRGCPALADLDSTDDTCLPDGSRLVDALALAAVVCHLGGLR